MGSVKRAVHDTNGNDTAAGVTADYVEVTWKDSKTVSGYQREIVGGTSVSPAA